MFIKKYRHNSIHLEMDIYALFIYASIIVDFYRKFSKSVSTLPIDVSIVRNITYITLFIAILYYAVKQKKYHKKLISVSIIFLLITYLSYVINYRSGIGVLYVDIGFMFLSRLLPAFYIGHRIVGNEEFLLASICKFRWFTLIYCILNIIYPELSESSYMTTSNNIVIPVAVYLIAKGKFIYRISNYIVAFFGFLVVVLYGGRGSLIGLILSILLYLSFLTLRNRSYRKYIISFISLFVFCFIFFKNSILEYMISLNPNSRTLNLIMKGDLLWSSNRNLYYDAAFDSFINHPFKIYGFFGDRLYYSRTFATSNNLEYISSLFSHNVFYELMLTLGIFIGLIFSLAFVFKMIKTYFQAFSGNVGGVIFYSSFLGVTFINMVTSSTYLSDPYIWLICGWLLNYTRIPKVRLSEKLT